MKNELVVKSNKLNESRYRLTVQEQRIVLATIAKIKPSDIDFNDYDFTVSEFVELAGVTKSKNMYSQIKKITLDLIGKTVTIKEPDGDLQIGWVSSVKYYDNEGRFTVSFDPKLKPYLLALKQSFVRYQLKNVIQLKSAYSVRIYELLKQYQSIGERFFKLDDLRKILYIPDGSLTPYFNFRARVLEVAKKELVDSDIGFDYTAIKTGRRITGIKFHIKSNSDVIKRSGKKKYIKSVEPDPIEKRKDEVSQDDLYSHLQALKKEDRKEYDRLYGIAKNEVAKSKKRCGVKQMIRFKMFELLKEKGV